MYSPPRMATSRCLSRVLPGWRTRLALCRPWPPWPPLLPPPCPTQPTHQHPFPSNTKKHCHRNEKKNKPEMEPVQREKKIRLASLSTASDWRNREMGSISNLDKPRQEIKRESIILKNRAYFSANSVSFHSQTQKNAVQHINRTGNQRRSPFPKR